MARRTLAALGLALVLPATAAAQVELEIYFGEPTDYVPGTDDVEYEVGISNEGDEDEEDLSFASEMPDGVTIVEWECQADDNDSECATPSSGDSTSDLDRQGDTVGADSSVTYELTLEFDPDLTAAELELEYTAETSDEDGSGDSRIRTLDLDRQYDLAIDFADDTPDDYTPGTDDSYTLELENIGPSDAPARMFTIIYPEGVEQLEFTCDPVDACDPSSDSAGGGDGELGMEVELDAGASVDVELDVDYDSRALDGSLVLEAEFDAGPDDQNDENDSATAEFELERRAAIEVEKTASDEQVTPNGEFAYFIDVTNLGPSDIGHDDDEGGVLVSDEFSSQLQGVAGECPESDGSEPCWSYCASDEGEDGEGSPLQPDDCPGEVQLVIGQGDIENESLSIAAGNTTRIMVHAAAESSASGSIYNMVNAGLDPDDDIEYESGSDDVSDETTVDVVIASDLTIDKDDEVSSAVPGETHSYTIEVRNEGFINAAEVGVYDELPLYQEPGEDDPGEAGFVPGTISFQCQAEDGACCNHNSSQCGGDGTPIELESADVLDQSVDLPAGSRLVFTVTGELDPRAEGTLENEAEVLLPPGDFEDTNPSNNVDIDDDTEMQPETELVLSKQLLDLEEGGEGGGAPYTLTYEIEVANNGPSQASSATVEDALDDNLFEINDDTAWYCEVVRSDGGTACLESSPANPIEGEAVEEEVVLGPGGAVRFEVEVQTTDAADGELTNTASVDDGLNAPVSDTITTDLTAAGDLSISKTSNTAGVAPGTGIEYVITVENEGDDAFGARVIDTFPPEIEDVSWSCEATTPIPGDLEFQRTVGADERSGRMLATTADGRHIYQIAPPDDSTPAQLFVFDRNATPGQTFGFVAPLETETQGVNDGQDTGPAVSGMDRPLDMVLAPDGNHVYVLSAGDSEEEIEPAIATFQRETDASDPDFGRLTFVDRVRAGVPEDPRRLAMTGEHLYVSGAERIAIFARDPATGLPGHDTDLEEDLPNEPLELAVDVGAGLLFAGAADTQGLHAYSIQPAGGGDPAGRLEIAGQLDAEETEGIADLVVAGDAPLVYAVAAGGAGLLGAIDYADIDDGAELAVAGSWDADFLTDSDSGSGIGSFLDDDARLDLAPDGEHLLITNRGENSLVQVRRDPISGGVSPEDGFTGGMAGHTSLKEPADLQFTPDGRHVLIATGADAGGTLTVYSRQAPDPLFAFVENDSEEDDTGDDGPIQGMLAPNDVAVSPDGNHVYVASLADDAISVFRRDPGAGMTDDTQGEHLIYVTSYFDGEDDLEGQAIEGLERPRRILVDDDAVYVTSEDENTLVVFDREDSGESDDFGRLSFRARFRDGEDGVDGLAGAQGMALDDSANHLYVAGSFDSAIAIFQRDSQGDLEYQGMVENGVDGVTGLSGIRDLAMAGDGSQLLGVSAFDNALVVFERETGSGDPEFGNLDIVEARQSGIGDRPMALAIPEDDADGGGEHVYVVGQNSDSVAVLRRVTDPSNSAFGQVQPLGLIDGDEVDFLAGPRDVAVSPDGKRVYVASEFDSALLVFDRDLNASGQDYGRLNLVETRRNQVDGVDGIDNLRGLAVSDDSRNVYGAGFGDGSVASFLLGTGSICTAGGGGNIDDEVDIGSSGTLVYRATGTVRADAEGTLSNTAEVQPPQRYEDTDIGNNEDTDTVTLEPEGDVSIEKASEQVSVVAGETASFDISIFNPGPSNLVNGADSALHLTDLLDDPSLDADSATWTCEASGSGALDFVAAWLPEADGGGDGFESMHGISGLARVDVDGSLPVLAGASVIDGAVLLFEQDDVDGSLQAPLVIGNGDALDGGTVTTLAGARSVAASADGRFLYVASRIADAVTVFELIDDNGDLQVDLVESHDDIPELDQALHLVLGPGDEQLYVAGANADAVVVFDRDDSDGTLDPIDTEQEGAPGDDGGTVNGLSDVQHLVISPDGEHLYSVSGSDGRIGVFARQDNGELVWQQGYGEADLGGSLDGASAAVMDSGGNNLYIPASGDDRILVLERASDGQLSLVSSVAQEDSGVAGLVGVRHLVLTDDDNHLYTTSPIGDSVAWFVRDAADGSLRYGGQRSNASGQADGLGGASELVLDSALGGIYVAGSEQSAISQFSRQDDSFCPASGNGSLDEVPFDVAADGTISFHIQVDVVTDSVGQITNTAEVQADRDPDGSNNSDSHSSPISAEADLVVTKDDGLSEYDGLEGAAAVAGTSGYIYTAGSDDAAIGIFEREENPDSDDFGRVRFADVLRDGDDGITGLDGVRALQLDSAGEHLYSAAAGDNAVLVMERDDEGGLEVIQSLQGGVDEVSGLSGARALAMSTDDAHVYVASEFSNAVAAFARMHDPGSADHGRLEFLDVVQEGVDGASGLAAPIAVQVTPDGRHVYVLGAETDSLAVLQRNPSEGSASFGRLEYLTHYTDGSDGVAGLAGARDLEISDDGQYVYALGDEDGTLAQFERDADSGELEFVEFKQDGTSGTVGLTGARSIHLSPAGTHLYVAGGDDASVTRFSVDGDDGTLDIGERIANGDAAPLTGGDVFGLDGAARLLIADGGEQLYAVAADADAVVTFQRGLDEPGVLDFDEILIDGQGGVAPGDPVIYTITVENLGPSDVLDATVIDEFPEQFDQVSWTCTSAGGAQCAGSGDGNLNEPVELPAGGRVTFQAGGPVDENATGRLINTATVESGSSVDPNPGDNEATDDDTVLAPSMDLVAHVDDGDDEATPGAAVDYEVRIENLGPSYGRDVVVEDHLPAAFYDVAWECVPHPRAGVLSPLDALDGPLDEHLELVISGNGRWAYAAGADAGTAAIAVYRRDPITGGLDHRQTLRQGEDGVAGLQGLADLVLSPDGRFLFAAGAAADSIAVFEREPADGTLEFLAFYQDGTTGIEGLGGVNRLLISEDGAWLHALGRADGALATFAVDATDGAIEQAGLLQQGVDGIDGLNSGSDLAWGPDGDHVLVAADGNRSLAAFAHDGATGELEPATLVLDFELDGDTLADPAALAVGEQGEVFVSSPGADRIDRFDLEPDGDGEMQFQPDEPLTADSLDLDALDSPADLVYRDDRRRLYVRDAGGLLLLSLMRSEPEVVASYRVDDLPELDGIERLAVAPGERHFYSLASQLGIWNSTRGSRCPVEGEGALGRQQTQIAAAGELTYQVTGTIQPNATGELVYEVEAATAQPEVELNPDDNVAEDSNTLVPGPDLAVDKSADPEPVVAGEGIEFHIEGDNFGPSDAVDAVLSDQPPLFPDETGGLVPDSGTWACQANPPLDDPQISAGEHAVDAVYAGRQSVYAVSSDDDAVIIRPRTGGGELGEAQVIAEGDALPGGPASGLEGAAAVVASADDRHLYVAGRDADSLAVLAREAAGEEWQFVQVLTSGEGEVFGLQGPRAVHLSPDGDFVYVAGTDSDAIVVFARDAESGELEFVERVRDGLGTIVPESNVIVGIRDLQMTADGAGLYAVAADSQAVSQFARDTDSGELQFEAVWRQGEEAGGESIDGIGEARALAAGPGDHTLYVLGATGLARFDRDADGSLDFAESWTDIPGLGEPLAVHVDAAGARAYVLDDAGIHVFARDWGDGGLDHREHFELASAADLAGETGAARLWLAVADEIRAYPELALSRCLSSGADSDAIDLDMDLGAGGYAEVVFDALVHPSARGDLVNTAAITPGAGTDPDPDNNVSETVTEIRVVSNIGITKTGPTEVIAGEDIDYQLVVTNAGPSDALGLTVTDLLADPLEDVQWTCSAGGDSSCPDAGSGDVDFVADVPVDDELVIDISARVDPAFVGEITNTADLTPEPGAEDPTPDDQSSEVITEVIAVADVSVDKGLDGDSLVAGMDVSWTIQIDNPGPSDAPVVAVEDLVDGRVDEVAWTCSGSGNCPSSGDGDVDFVADLPAGTDITIDLEGVVGAAATGQLDNTATVLAADPVEDPDGDNNQSTTSHAIAVEPDLALSLVDPLDPFDPDGSLDLPYEIEIVNGGPSDATGVVLSLEFDSEVSVDSGGLCADAGGGTFSCDVGTMASGETLELDLAVSDLPAAGGSLALDGEVTTMDDDPDLSNNTASTNTALENGGDVMVIIDNGFDWVSPNQELVYAVDVTNIGSSAVDEADVEVPVSADLLEAQWSCEPDPGTECLDSGTGDIEDSLALDPGQGVIYYLSVRVDPDLEPDPDQPVTVSQTATAPVPGDGDINDLNNSAIDEDVVRRTIFADGFENTALREWVDDAALPAEAQACERIHLSAADVPARPAAGALELLHGVAESGDVVVRIQALRQFGADWLRLSQQVEDGFRASGWLPAAGPDLDVALRWQAGGSLEMEIDGEVIHRFDRAGPLRPAFWQAPPLPLPVVPAATLEVGACAPTGGSQ